MRKLSLVSCCLVILAGCGPDSGSAHITITHYDEIEQLRVHQPEGYIYDVAGWANWQYTENGTECQIYMMNKDWYFNETDYHSILGHEARHCFEGDFHAE